MYIIVIKIKYKNPLFPSLFRLVSLRKALLKNQDMYTKMRKNKGQYK